VRAEVVKKRRQALGLEQPEFSLIDPATEAQRELEGGTILVGRPALKEYLSGLRAGWSHGVDEWIWEKEIEKTLKDDGFFDEPEKVEATPAPEVETQTQTTPEAQEAPAPGPAPKSRFGFLSRQAPPPAPAAPAANGEPAPQAIPAHLHTPPTPLPPQPPILLVPFTSYLGFKQIPYMIYNFFTESKRVQAGAEAAYALITNTTRPFTAQGPHPDTEFGVESEAFYKADYATVPEKNEKMKKEYYTELAKRLESARQFARGERELTDAEKRDDKPVTTVDDLKEERKKREMRWAGGLEGWNIVKPETPLAWEDSWEGWLRVFDNGRKEKEEKGE